MNTPIEEARKLINKEVTITNERGAKYTGILSGVRNKDMKFCLTRLLIINKNGGIIASKRDKSRWFDLDKFCIVEENNSKCEPKF